MTFAELLLLAGLVLCGLGTLIEALRRRSAKRAPAPGMPVPPELREQVRVLLSEDRPVEAIRQVRKATGLGLVEAKQLVDDLRDEQRN